MNERTSRKEIDLRARADDALVGNGFITRDDSTYLLLESGTKLTAQFKKGSHPKYGLAVSKNGNEESLFILNVAKLTFEKTMANKIKLFERTERREARNYKKEIRAAVDRKSIKAEPKEESVINILANSKSFRFLCSICKTVKPETEMTTPDLCEACKYNKELGII